MEADDLKVRVEQIVSVYEFGPPCTEDDIRRAEAGLGQPLPAILKELYLAFDGFDGPAANFLWPLHGDNGLVSYNLWLRQHSDAPTWAREMVFFGDDGIGGTVGSLWGVLTSRNSEIVQWFYQDGEDARSAGTDIFGVWARRQVKYDNID